MLIVMYASNSGGKGWLSEEQIAALVQAGWIITDDTMKSMGCIEMVRVDEENEDLHTHISRWEEITGADSDAGCNCCGPAFSFSAWSDSLEDFLNL